MDSKEIFYNLLDEVSAGLDSVGLYAVNIKINLSNDRLYESYEELRNKIINEKVLAFINVDCFIGNEAWRKEEIFETPEEQFLDMTELKISDIADYFKKRLEEGY